MRATPSSLFQIRSGEGRSTLLLVLVMLLLTMGGSIAVTFGASLFLANRIYARIGFMGALLIFPVIYLLGFSGTALYPAFATIAALRFFQLVWRLGIADTAYQAIFKAEQDRTRCRLIA